MNASEAMLRWSLISRFTSPTTGEKVARRYSTYVRTYAGRTKQEHTHQQEYLIVFLYVRERSALRFVLYVL